MDDIHTFNLVHALGFKLTYVFQDKFFCFILIPQS